MRNTLYYGDDLEIMRKHLADEAVDLVYLDPPFNSARDYNVLFKQAKKDENQAQITAFTDTWVWSKKRYEEFFEDSANAPLIMRSEASIAKLQHPHNQGASGGQGVRLPEGLFPPVRGQDRALSLYDGRSIVP